MSAQSAGPTIRGAVLAAGAGTRYGRPKAMVGTWLRDRVDALRAGGCSDVVVVLGADAEEARRLVPPGARVVVADDWREGMAASLRAALGAAASPSSTGEDFTVGLVVALVDTPGLTSAAVSRLVHAVEGADALARACYGGEPGHPVFVGRAHWDAMAAVIRGDSGGRSYLDGHEVALVECGDVADGRDMDMDHQTLDNQSNMLHTRWGGASSVS